MGLTRKKKKKLGTLITLYGIQRAANCFDLALLYFLFMVLLPSPPSSSSYIDIDSDCGLVWRQRCCAHPDWLFLCLVWAQWGAVVAGRGRAAGGGGAALALFYGLWSGRHHEGGDGHLT